MLGPGSSTTQVCLASLGELPTQQLTQARVFAALQLYKQHFAADAVEDEDDDADGTPEGDEEGKEARKRQVRMSAFIHRAAAFVAVCQSAACVLRWDREQQ